MSGPGTFGVVIGAGGVLGVSWSIGALAALEQATGLDTRDASVVVGTSAGAVTAAALGCGVATSLLVRGQAGLPPAPGEPDLSYDYAHHRTGLPTRPRLRVGSPPLVRRALRHPRRVTFLGKLAGLLPRGNGSLAALGELVDAFAPPGADWAPHPRTWLVGMDYSTGERVPFGRPGAPRATLRQAVLASCSIPAWYPPTEIGGQLYVDGGMCSPVSLDLVAPLGLECVYVLSPMTSLSYDRPETRAARIERRIRKLTTRRLKREIALVERVGTRVVLLCPGPEDLAVIGANVMDPSRRTAVFEVAKRTVADAFRTREPRAAG